MRNNKFIKIFLLPFLFFAVITSIMIFSWFRYGYLYGGGDVGLPSYNPQRILEITKFIWWEAAAPGTTVPHGLTSVPLQFFQSLLQEIGIPYIAIQAILFWLILFLSGYGMFLVGVSIFGKEKFILAILSGLFYILNPNMMIQVWHRFVHTTFFLAAALPFIYLFWRGWINRGAYISLFLFLLTNFLASYLYGTLAFILTILLVLIFIFLFEIFFPWKGIRVFKNSSIRFIIGLVFWFLINSWWMLPSFNVAPAVFSAQHTVEENLATLLAISQQTIIPYSILGINPFYLYYELDFGEIYDTYLFRLLSWFSLIFLIPGFLKSLTTRNYLCWSLFFILAIFLAKGAASPFGHPYVLGFNNFFALGVLRNPFEKLGILLPFSMAILLPIGVYWYVESFKRFKWLTRGGIMLVLILLLGVNLWPMWLGKVFGKIDAPALISVPESYSKADEFIAKQNKPGRILHLPLTSGESVTYHWTHGYSGVEPSQLLFKSLPSISHGFNINYIDNSLNAIATSFGDNRVNPSKALKILGDFNIRFIILHRDIVWEGGLLQNPEGIENILDNFTFLADKKEFGDLVIYEVKEEYFKPKLILSFTPDYLVDNYQSSYTPYFLRKNDLGNFMSTVDGKIDLRLLHDSSEIIVTPKISWQHYNKDLPIEQITSELPAVKILPNSFLYSLIKLKENLQLFGSQGQKSLILKITFAGKRLKEAYKLKNLNNKQIISFKSYKRLIEEIFENSPEELKNTPSIKGHTLTDIFTRHLLLLKHLKTQLESDSVEYHNLVTIEQELTEYLRKNQLLPLYDISQFKKEGFSLFNISQFELPKDGGFELLMDSQKSQEVYPDKLLNLRWEIDGQIYDLKGKNEDKFISYDKIELARGIHEIIIPAVFSNNLIPSSDNLIKQGNIVQTGDQFEVNSGDHGSSLIEAEILPLSPLTWYEISFESWIKKGDRFKIQLVQDTDQPDPKNPGQTVKDLDKTISKDLYNNYWQEQKVSVLLRSLTKKSSVKLLVEPWDDCKIIVVNKELCKAKQFRYNYEHEAVVVFKNLKINRLLGNPLFLYSKEKDVNYSKSVGQIINFERKNPVMYVGNFNNAKPGYLIFKESYHPDWELILNDGKNTFIPSKRYIADGFSNAWFIDKSGDYNFILEFTSQRFVQKGIIISIISLILIGGVFLWQRFKNEI